MDCGRYYVGHFAFSVMRASHVSLHTPVAECLCNLSEQSGAVEACWAHNPEVRGSKPRSANTFISRHPHPFYSRPHCPMSRHQHSLSLGRTFPDPIHTHARYHYQCSSQHVLRCTPSGLYYYKRQSCAISHIQHLFHLL